MSTHILYVEDDPDIASGVVAALEDEGYRVEHTPHGEVGLKRAQSLEHDLIILDVRLPGLTGFDVCRELRRSSPDLPVLFVTARDTEMDTVLGLELGGDDYLAKPFGIQELLARVRALLRRSRVREGAERRIRVHDLTILPERRSVYRGGERIHFTNSEFTLLHTLARRPGMVFTREMLMEALWETDLNTGSLQTVNVHVRKIRDRLADDPENPRYIETVRGVGYRILDDQR